MEKASADPARLVRLFKRLADDGRSRVGEAMDQEDVKHRLRFSGRGPTALTGTRRRRPRRGRRGCRGRLLLGSWAVARNALVCFFSKRHLF